MLVRAINYASMACVFTMRHLPLGGWAILVPRVGFEPTCHCWQRFLRPLCLPIPSSRQMVPKGGVEPPRPQGRQLLRLLCLPVPPSRPVEIGAGIEPAHNSFADCRLSSWRSDQVASRCGLHRQVLAALAATPHSKTGSGTQGGIRTLSDLSVSGF